MKKRNSYIKQLEYKFFSNFGINYLSVSYYRNNEFNHYTLSNISKNIAQTALNARKLINK